MYFSGVEWLETYRPTERIGGTARRKFGSVYRGECIATGEPVIIKCVEKQGVNDTVVSAIRNEVEFSFDSDGLPKILAYFETETDCILIKQLQPGVSLTDHWSSLKKKERIPFIQAFTAQLSRLLDALHAEGIFHGDLKPSNVLIHTSGTDMTVELIDFGLAFRSPAPLRSLVFPLGYAAPELILNRLDLVNRSTDYFSLGILFWRLFCDRLPLHHPNPGIYTNLQLVHPLPDDSRLPRHLFPVIQRLTCKPTFPTAPNRMTEDAVTACILDAQQKRYPDSQLLLEDLGKLKYLRFGIV